MPKITEVSVSYSMGGQVAIHDYGKLNSSFLISQSEKYDVTDCATLEEALAFRAERREALVEEIEAVAQREQDWRVEWRDQEQKKLAGESGSYS